MVLTVGWRVYWQNSKVYRAAIMTSRSPCLAPSCLHPVRQDLIALHLSYHVCAICTLTARTCCMSVKLCSMEHAMFGI